MKRSKKYLTVIKKLKPQQKYSLEEAVKLMPELSTSKFAGSVNVEIQLKLNEKQKKDTIRGSFSLPNRFGKDVKILVFSESGKSEDAKDADHFGGIDLIEKVEKGELDYDVVIATPEMMPKIARLGKILGTKGLMPNPKNGTITTNLKQTIAKFKSGMKNFKMKDGQKITAVIGKTDMASEKVLENFQAFFKAVNDEIKKYGPQVIKTVLLCPSMGPVVNVDLSTALITD